MPSATRASISAITTSISISVKPRRPRPRALGFSWRAPKSKAGAIPGETVNGSVSL